MCTYLRPSVLPHAELLDVEGVSKFVSEYILFEALTEGGRDPPELLASPASTLAWQVEPMQAFAPWLHALCMGFVQFCRAIMQLNLAGSLSKKR